MPRFFIWKRKVMYCWKRTVPGRAPSAGSLFPVYGRPPAAGWLCFLVAIGVYPSGLLRVVDVAGFEAGDDVGGPLVRAFGGVPGAGAIDFDSVDGDDDVVVVTVAR